MIALADKGQRTHSECAEAVKKLSGTLITTWACFTEALYFLHGIRGWHGQDALWQYVKEQEIFLHSPKGAEPLRAYELMKKYHDMPLDFADASLVVLAEARGLNRIITADSDFFAYRIHDKDSFEVIKINP